MRENERSKRRACLGTANAESCSAECIIQQKSIQLGSMNSEGNHVKVKGYDDNGALFLYENSSQLKSILDSVVERAVAKEEANK